MDHLWPRGPALLGAVASEFTNSANAFRLSLVPPAVEATRRAVLNKFLWLCLLCFFKAYVGDGYFWESCLLWGFCFP